MPEKTVAINNELGLHARAAAQFVRVSTQFECDIFLSWRDIEVQSTESGKPTIHLSGGALLASERRGIHEILISISHCRSHATAFALAVGDEHHV